MDNIQEQSLKWEDLPFEENKTNKIRVKFNNQRYWLYTSLEKVNLNNSNHNDFIDGVVEYLYENVQLGQKSIIVSFKVDRSHSYLNLPHDKETKNLFNNLKLEPVKLSDEDLYIYGATNINKL